MRPIGKCRLCTGKSAVVDAILHEPQPGKKEYAGERADVFFHMINHHEMFLRQFPGPTLPVDLRYIILELFTRILRYLLNEIKKFKLSIALDAARGPIESESKLAELHEKAKRMEAEAKLIATAEHAQTGSRDILAAMGQMAREISELRSKIRDLTAVVNQVAKLRPGRGR
jgi:hypothetical protein